VTDRPRIWWNERTPRERLLMLAASAVMVVVLTLRAWSALHADLDALRQRVAAAESDLRAVRRLAGRVERITRDGAPPIALMPYLEAVADSTVGRDRIAAMMPVMTATRQTEGVSLRIVETSLEETVRLLHALESGSPQVRPTALHLIEHPHAAGVFDAVVEVERREARP